MAKGYRLKVIVSLLLGFCWCIVLPKSNAEEPAPAQEEKKVPKAQERISLDLKGVDINELFKVLSAKSGLTIITTPSVSGRVTVLLNNLTFDDALDVIMVTQNLAYERKESMIKVMTAAEYEKLYGKKFGELKKVKVVKLLYAKPANIVNVISAIKSDVGKIIVDEPSGTLILIDAPPSISLMEETIKGLDQPLETAVFDINYARSQDIKGYLTELITPGVGQVIIDERSNKAIVSDLPQRLVKITRLMKELDEETRQVLIDVEIIQVSLSDKFSRGIDWEGLFLRPKYHGLDFVGEFPVSPVLSTYQKISIGTLSRDGYNLVFNMLEEFGNTKILSRPRMVVVNKEEAKILVGSREAFITQSLSQAQTTTVRAETVQFIDVGVKLKVVPTIGKDGFITMRIKPEISSVRETLTTSEGSQIPIVETSETETVVKVKDGTTIMIGGMVKDETRDAIKGWPGASKLPLVGTFFGNRIKQSPVKTETIVFITPHLIKGDLQIVEAKSEIKK
jgi:MSHA biogenesis protein MshL